MSMAQRAVDAALKVLSDRGGFDGWWDCIDEDIQQEIREEMIDEVDKVIDG